VRIQIKGDALHGPEAAPKFYQKIKIEIGDLPGHRNLHRVQKTADSRLNRKRGEIGDFLKDSVSLKKIHLPGPGIPQKHAVQTAKKHIANAVFTFSSAFYFNPMVELLFDSVSLKESPDETASAKPGEIFTAKLFLNQVNCIIAFVLFLRYILFHLLSASSLEKIVFGQPLLYYRWRHFSW